MKAWLEIQRTTGIDRRDVHPLTENPAIGVADGACPGCGSTPFLVQGGNLRIDDRETYKADGRSRCCGDLVGYLFCATDTVFGLEEDRAVLQARARVYG